MAGRRSKLTPERKQKLVDALKGGNYRQTAALYAGIGVSTFYRWLEIGEADLERDKQSPERELLEAVKEAEAQAEIAAIALISRAAADGSWQAAAWRLERKYPDRWGRRERHEHTGVDGGPITITTKDEFDREVEALVAKVRASADGGSPN